MVYNLFRGFWRAALWVFFRKIEVEGREWVPERGPLLIVPNHTNALVDPLLILLQLRRPLTVTAKTTLAANRLLALVMRALNVITFARRQDQDQGFDPEANRRAFDECRRRLRAGAAICIFPEGVSHSDPELRPFRTGAARIALEYLEHEGNTGDLKIVPAGLYFEKKDRFRSSAWLRFGEPVDLADWRRKNLEAGARELTAEVERRVRELTLNFEEAAEVELFNWAAEVIATGGHEPLALGREEQDRLGRRIRVVKALQSGYRELRETHSAAVEALERRLRDYRLELARWGLTPVEVYLPMDAGRAAFFVLRELELLLIGLPLAAWGALNHVLPFQITKRIGRKMSSDEDHFASNAVFISLVVFPFFYALQIATVGLLFSFSIALLYGAMLPYSGAVAVLYRDRAGGSRQRTRAFLRLLRQPELQRLLAMEGRAIIAEVERLAEEIERGRHDANS